MIGLALAARGRLSSPTGASTRRPAHDTYHQNRPPEAIRHRSRGSYMSQTRHQPVLGPVDNFPRGRLFRPSAPSCGVRAHGGSEATSQKMCARCGISSQRGQRPRVCRNFHSNLTLGDSALPSAAPSTRTRRRLRPSHAARSGGGAAARRQKSICATATRICRERERSKRSDEIQRPE